MLYEVAMVQKPTKKELDETNASEKLIFGPECVIAKDDRMAAVAAVAQAMDKLPVDLSNVEVLVRPFVSRS